MKRGEALARPRRAPVAAMFEIDLCDLADVKAILRLPVVMAMGAAIAGLRRTGPLEQSLPGNIADLTDPPEPV